MNFDDNDNDAVESGEEEPEIPLSEMRKTINHLKGNKSPGPDEVLSWSDTPINQVPQSYIVFVIRSEKQKPGQLNGKTLPFSLYQGRARC